MKTSSELTLMHLSLISGIGPSLLKIILDINPAFNFEQIYNLSITELQNIFNISEKMAQKIFYNLQNKDLLYNELDLINQHNIKWTTVISNNYPYLLKNIHLPPIILYWQGQDLNDDDKRIAIIGSREANDYGKKIVDSLVKPLIDNNWIIVSGGAIGADTMAHEASVENNGKTIVILGSGLLRPYPASNSKLFKRIIENCGTILSTYPLKMEPLAQNFPQRNRIISGISKGCIVVQAAIKSGTRITALHALEQGREVFAVPGIFDDELSSGCHKLIQEGAKLISNVNDILQEFGESHEINQASIFDNQAQSGIKEISIEAKIMFLCSKPYSIDDLSKQLNMESDELQNLLFQLQIDGKIVQNFMGFWQTV